MPAQLFVAHGLVRSGGDQNVEFTDPAGEFCVDDFEQQRHWHRPSAVRDDQENASAIDVELCEPLRDDCADLGLGEETFVESFADDAQPSKGAIHNKPISASSRAFTMRVPLHSSG